METYINSERGLPGIVQAGQSGVLTPETLKTAQEAAQAARETPSQLIVRAVETRAQLDKLTRKKKGGAS